ncbi:MAG: (Fe-S)-binding protein [Gammaproteobacteria bacterium]|nr:(Fe-S)-binding protein [Gammaproteobacteria bacterium]
MTINQTLNQTISQLANQCVLCAICIPHCPTYAIFRTENESPRGRITLYKALVEEKIEPNEELLSSLDHCLGCYACEKICPSQVDYSQINRLGRAFMSSHYELHKPSLKQKIVEKVLVTPSLHPLLKLAAKTLSHFQSPVQKTPPKKELAIQTANQIATQEKKQSTFSFFKQFSQEIVTDSIKKYTLPECSRTKAQVILFKGCSGDLFEQQILEDTLLLLNACQFKVITPEQSQCCGAVHIRHGDAEAVHNVTKKNIETFMPLLKNSQAIISINNSCSAHLKTYKNILAHPEAEEFSHKTMDALTFLSYAIKAANIQFSALKDNHIAVHVPCSLKNSLKSEHYLFELLNVIPDIQLSKLNDHFCCGAAGSYMLKYPEIANTLLDKKIDEIESKQYKTIVSSNIGCTLHFKQGLNTRNIMPDHKIEVIHPIRLLAQQLIINH